LFFVSTIFHVLNANAKTSPLPTLKKNFSASRLKPAINVFSKKNSAAEHRYPCSAVFTLFYQLPQNLCENPDTTAAQKFFSLRTAQRL